MSQQTNAHIYDKSESFQTRNDNLFQIYSGNAENVSFYAYSVFSNNWKYLIFFLKVNFELYKNSTVVLGIFYSILTIGLKNGL